MSGMEPFVRAFEIFNLFVYAVSAVLLLGMSLPVGIALLLDHHAKNDEEHSA